MYEQPTPQPPMKHKGNPLGYFLMGLFGVMVGALLVWFIVGPKPQTDSATTPSNVTTQQVATDVTTDATDAVGKVSKAVVGITNIQKVADFWSQQTGEQEAGSGSGVIYKIEDGKAFIVTNYHVIENAERLEVTLDEGSKREAELLGGDMWTDLAVIAIDAKDITTVAQFGDSDSLKQGEPVLAIGNPLGLDFYGSVTQGVVSGVDRTMPIDFNKDGIADWEQEVLQTDAAINPGNSGGALVNIKGDVIGINSMKIAVAKVEGLGFAIPINAAIPIIEELEQRGEVQRPVLGVSLTDLTNVPAFYQQQTLQIPKEITTGVVITDIVRGSAAAEAGAKQYDVIVEMDGEKIESASDLRKHLYNKKKIGDELTMKVYRQGKLVELQAKLVDDKTL
ncbi:MAG TPA: trypsin-like peptidase domain-containing protein [Metalysinibacillus jejuensis]|uniref:Trypsin-like peptidase domain-containing protein n=1 Tax=Metalysinibacillus jejuensis TaxID=914327 RepID=A0A921NCA2_9BACL|nr:trypsin-like peptidase domain-containing protein [Metalysinibacillus jejuensis]